MGRGLTAAGFVGFTTGNAGAGDTFGGGVGGRGVTAAGFIGLTTGNAGAGDTFGGGEWGREVTAAGFVGFTTGNVFGGGEVVVAVCRGWVDVAGTGSIEATAARW
jgi:hypothetical protein